MEKNNELRTLVKAAEALCNMSYVVLVKHAHEHCGNASEADAYFMRLAEIQKVAKHIVIRMAILHNDDNTKQEIKAAETNFNETFIATYKQAVTERPF